MTKMDTDAEYLVRELRHELINSFQLIESILAIQARGAKNEESSRELQAARLRVMGLSCIYHNSCANVIVDEVDMHNYINSIVKNICVDLKTRIVVDSRIGTVRLGKDQARTCALLIGELLLYSLTANDSATGEQTVQISATEELGEIELRITTCPGYRNGSTRQSLARDEFIELLLAKLSATRTVRDREGGTVTVRFKKAQAEEDSPRLVLSSGNCTE